MQNLVLLIVATLIGAAPLGQSIKYSELERNDSSSCDSIRYAFADVRLDTVLTIGAKDSTIHVVVFMNAYSCARCFQDLDRVLSKYQADTAVRLVASVRSSGGGVDRRRWITIARAQLPNVSTVVFDFVPRGVRDDWPPIAVKGGVFGELAVSKTPALLIAGRGRSTYLSYVDLFGGDLDEGGTSESRLRQTVSAAISHR